MRLLPPLVAAATLACGSRVDRADSARGVDSAATLPAPATPGAPATMARAPIPFADTGACPFEGCKYRVWMATRRVDVRVAPSRDSAPAFQIPANAWVRALTGVVVTTVPGRVTFGDTTYIHTGADSLRATPADTLLVLHGIGEGFVTAWFRGRLYRSVDGTRFSSGTCPRGACAGRVIAAPRIEWWVQVRDDSGRTGWTSAVESFACKDQLGGDRRCDSHQASKTPD